MRKRLYFISTWLRRGFSIYLSPPQATLWHAVSRPCVAYDDESFSGKRRVRNSGFRKEYVVIDGHLILFGAHIDDFVIACANQPVHKPEEKVLETFRKRLLEAFEGTYEGPLEHYLVCEMPLITSPAPLLSHNSIMPRRFFDHTDFGIFYRVAHL